MTTDEARIRISQPEPDDGKIIDVEGQQRWDIDPETDGAEEIASAYEQEMRRQEGLVYDESKSEFHLDCSVLFDWKEAGEGNYIADRFLGASISFLEINETDTDYFQTIGTATLIEDSTLIFKNGDAAAAMEKLPALGSAPPEFLTVAVCSALAVLCVQEVFYAEFFPRLKASTLPIKRRRAFLRGTSKRLPAALIRETKDKSGYCLRGQRGAHGSESFRENVREFVKKELDALIRQEFRYIPVARKAMDEFKAGIIITRTPPKKLQKLPALAAELAGMTQAQKDDYISTLQAEARNNVFEQDDGNGIPLLSRILLDERLARIKAVKAQEAAKRTRKRRSRSAAAKEEEAAAAAPVAKFADLNTADFLSHTAELETGYLPRGPQGRAVAIYADVVLKELNRPSTGKLGEYHRIQSEKALVKLAVYKKQNDREAIPLFGFKPVDTDENGEPLARPVWLLWGASDWFFFPYPIEKKKKLSFQKDVLLPSMFAEVYSLALGKYGMNLETAGAINKAALFIASTLQTEIDGREARIREHPDAKDTLPQATAEGRVAHLPLPDDRHRRRDHLEILRAALAVADIALEVKGQAWEAHKSPQRITSDDPEIPESEPEVSE